MLQKHVGFAPASQNQLDFRPRSPDLPVKLAFHARSAPKRFFPASSLILMKNVRSSAAAEKGGEGMALKIRTQAEDMPDGIDNLESHAHAKWKRATFF